MIWLIGNKGMLGSDIEKALLKNKINYISSDLEVDITNSESIYSFVKDKNISWVINASAYSNVDKAEEEPDKAYNINADGVRNLAELCKSHDIKLINISSDYVFDGKSNIAYSEDDAVNPLNVYGVSKLGGEDIIKTVLEKYYIIRTSSLFGISGKNFVKTIIELSKINKEIKVVEDQFSSPTYAVDLADFIIKVLLNKYKYGTYHFTNDGVVSWYGFAREIIKVGNEIGMINKDVKIIPISTAEYGSNVKRPQYSVLSKEKIKNEMQLNIRRWEESLIAFMKEFNK